MTTSTEAISSYSKPIFISKKLVKFEVSEDVFNKYNTSKTIHKHIQRAMNQYPDSSVVMKYKNQKIKIR